MAELDDVRKRLGELKSAGKTESTSKEAGKLSSRLRALKKGSPSGSIGSTDLGGFGSTFGGVADAIRGQLSGAQQTLQSGTDALKQRFSKLTGDIQAEGEIARSAQEQATSAELARRGITESSGLAQNQLAQALRPAIQSTQTQLGQLGVQQEGLLQGIRERIASLQAQPAQAGLGAALSLFGQQQQAGQFDRNLALQQAQQSLQARQFEEVTAPTSAANIQNIISQISDRGKTDPTEELRLSLVTDLINKLKTGTSSTGANFSQNITGAEAISALEALANQ